MKKQQFLKRFLAFLSLTLTLSVALGGGAAFPIFAEESSPDMSVIPDYVILDADYLNDNLESKYEVSTGKASWSYIDCELREDEFKYVRFNILNKDGKKHNDPYIGLDIDGDYSADDYKYVTVFVKTDENPEAGVTRSGKRFQIFFQAGSEVGYNEKKSTTAVYAGIEGYQVLTFDFSNNEAFAGPLNKLRLDVYSHGEFGEGEYCDIAAIVLSKDPATVYESAFEVLQSIYPAKQVLSNFVEDERIFFDGGTEIKAGSCDTKVSIKDGNVHYDIAGNYNDPYASFYYKELMDFRGVAESERLTTDDFNYTVMRYRSSPYINTPRMQLFLFAGDNYHPFKVDDSLLSPSSTYSVTKYNNWNSLVIPMNNNPKTAAGWTGDFNGFRVDWCNQEIRDDTFFEISDILFYSDGDAAKAFSAALNTLTLPVPGEKIGHDGSYFKPFAPKDSYSLLWAEELSNGIVDSEVANHSLLKSSSMDVVRLNVTQKSDAPYVELNVGGRSADDYKYITVLVKSKVGASPLFSIYYPNENGEYDHFNLGCSRYADNSDWQVLVINFSELSSWSGNIEKLKLEFLNNGLSHNKGTSCQIAGLAFCEDVEAVYDSAYYMLSKAYSPVQTLNCFAEDDIPFFQRNDEEGNTSLRVENGNMIYTATGESDPQKTFNYEGYAKKNGLKPVTTDVFQYTVIRYRCQGIKSTLMDLYYMTGDAKNLNNMIRHDFTDENGKYRFLMHMANTRYIASTEWATMILNMARTDGNPENSKLMNGWHREDGNTRFQGFRVDWCGTGAVGSFMEISDFIFFDDAEDANAFSAALNSIYIPASFTDPEPEDTDQGGEDITEESESTLDTEYITDESIPEFEDSEETTEEIPEFPTESDTEPEEESSSGETEITVDTDESDIEADNETTEPDEGQNTESESASAGNEDESYTESGDNTVTRPDGNLDLDDDETGSDDKGGSTVPFNIACICLAGLSVASLATVIYIRIKSKKEQ